MLDYSLLEDEQLVALIKKSDGKAFSVLTERYFPAADYHASRYSSSPEEKEDLSQEGMMGFISAVYSYKEDGEAAFSTYANHCIRNRIISAVRSAKSKKRIPAELFVPLDEQENFVSAFETPEENLISQSESKRIHSLIKDLLTEKEQKIFLLYLSGISYKEIAEQTDCTPKSVDSTLQRVRKKLREKIS